MAGALPMPNVRALLDFIAQPESGGDYNIVWGGIKSHDRPPRPLTEMTIGQVLAWQDSIDPKYMSEAAGRYQIMEDTLRTLYAQAGLTVNHLFDEQGQDILATALLARRGLNQYLRGEISTEAFANSLAREWASLPVVSGRKKGQSHYAGDGLNKSHVSVKDFLDAVRSVRGAVPMNDDDLVFKPTGPAAPRSLYYGATGHEVERLQQDLAALKYYLGAIDGDFGPNTESAVKEFQRGRGIDIDGRVGPETRREIEFAMRDRADASRQQGGPVRNPMSLSVNQGAEIVAPSYTAKGRTKVSESSTIQAQRRQWVAALIGGGPGVWAAFQSQDVRVQIAIVAALGLSAVVIAWSGRHIINERLDKWMRGIR